MGDVISHSDPGAVPGGSTRFQSRVVHEMLCTRLASRRDANWTWRGRNRIDEGVKAVLSLGMVSAVIGPNLIVANDNYAEARLAA